MIRWAAVILASLSWLFAFRHYVDENHAGQWGLVIGAVGLGAFGLGRYRGCFDLSRKHLLLLIPIAAALLLALPGYRPGLYVLALGAVVLARSSGRPGLGVVRPVGVAALLLGTVLILQSASYWLCTGWTARDPEVPYLGAVLHVLLAWLGADVSYSGGTLYVRVMRAVHEFPLLWDHVAIFPLLQIWLAGALVVWLDRRRRSFLRTLAGLTGTLIGYAVLRLFVMIPLFVTAMLFVKHESDTVHVELFWLPWITAVSFLPLIPIVSRLVPWPADGPDLAAAGGKWDSSWRRRVVLALACVAGLGATLGVHFWDPGTPKPGRILLDEAHSRWERTDHAYDTDWYGNESGYNYYCMAQYLRHFYSLDFNMDGLLTAEKLADYDVLILKTPTDAYSPEELDAIEAFVRRGGGLFALGEHTNVFGSSVFLNEVTRRFGIAFRYNSVFDITRKWEQVHFPSGLRQPRWWGARLGVHPIMQYVPFFRFAVSCSIATDSWRVRPVIRSGGLWSLPIEYSAGNFYPHVEDTTYAKFGAFNQAVSTTAGEGRVAAFGDSTVYSNFLAFYPGKPEFLLATVNWLNRRNQYEWINTLGFALFAAGVLALLLLSRRLRPHLGFCAAVAACVAATVWVGMWACAACASQSYRVPAAHTPPEQVVFEMQHSSYGLPLFSFTKDYPNSYDVFYLWVLRLGYYTTVSFDLDRALQSDDPIVLIKPTEPFPAETMSAVRAFLERGGSLLVLESPNNEKSTTNSLLRPFGLAMTSGPCRGFSLKEESSGAQICGVRSAQGVEGGATLLTTNYSEPVVAYTKVGAGQLVVAGLAERFCDTQMGGSWRTVPNHEMRAVYELEFALMRGLVQGDVPGQMRALGRTYTPETSESE